MNSMMVSRVILLAIATGGLIGCDAANGGSSGSAPMVYDPAIRTEIDQSLAQSAARASNALETLALIQRARTTPPAVTVDDSGMPPELRRASTVEFSGPAVELVRELAQNIGYAFIETGAHPANPGLVSVDAKDIPVAKVLEDVGLQAQKFATVIIDPNQKRVEFRNERGGVSVADAAASSSHEKSHHHTARAKRHYVKVAKAKDDGKTICTPCSLSQAPAPVSAGAPPVTTPQAAAAVHPTPSRPHVPLLPQSNQPPPVASSAPAAPVAAPVAAPAIPAAAPAPAAPAAPNDGMPAGMVPVTAGH